MTVEIAGTAGRVSTHPPAVASRFIRDRPHLPMNPLSEEAMKRALLSLSVLGLAGAVLAADFGFLRPLRVFRVTSKDPEQVLHVQEAVRVRDRYLAVVLTTSRTREGRERLKELYGVSYFLAPAWFSDQWKLLRLGDGLFAGLREVTPTPSRAGNRVSSTPWGFPDTLSIASPESWSGKPGLRGVPTSSSRLRRWRAWTNRCGSGPGGRPPSKSWTTSSGEGVYGWRVTTRVTCFIKWT